MVGTALLGASGWHWGGQGGLAGWGRGGEASPKSSGTSSLVVPWPQQGPGVTRSAHQGVCCDGCGERNAGKGFLSSKQHLFVDQKWRPSGSWEWEGWAACSCHAGREGPGYLTQWTSKTGEKLIPLVGKCPGCHCACVCVRTRVSVHCKHIPVRKSKRETEH